MDDLRVTLIQTSLVWEDVDANLLKFDALIDKAAKDSHLIVLPELFTTGFTMDGKNNSQRMNGESVTWLKKKSREKNIDITGSMIIEESGCLYNRLIWAKPDGQLFSYDKKHLFSYAGEHKVFSPGNANILININGWKIRPFICYDLRFPIWTRNLRSVYDVSIFIANWPEKRSAHWKALLMARAIENQSYVIGVNRIGTDAADLYHSGDSSAIDSEGNIIFQKKNSEVVATVTLAHDKLEKYRKNFPALIDADD